jgi:hypothetical protein
VLASSRNARGTKERVRRDRKGTAIGQRRKSFKENKGGPSRHLAGFVLHRTRLQGETQSAIEDRAGPRKVPVERLPIQIVVRACGAVDGGDATESEGEREGERGELRVRRRMSCI